MKNSHGTDRDEASLTLIVYCVCKEKCAASDQSWRWGGPGNEVKSVIYFIAARMRVKEEFWKNQSVTDQNQISQVC